jgi:hypothetical protein
VSLLFFDVCVPFDATFGSESPAERPRIDAWQPLEAALRNAESWTTALPANALEAIVIRASVDAPPLLIDPVGGARLRERVLPLNKKLDKLGEAVLTGANKFEITEVRVGTRTDLPHTMVKDHFARAQFENLSDAERLSIPSFEPMDAGVEFGSTAVTAGAGLTSSLTYETRIVDFPYDTQPAPVYELPRGHLLAMLGSGAIAKSPIRMKGSKKFAPEHGRVIGATLDDETYVIASASDLKARADLSSPSSKGDAQAALKAHLAAHPEDRERLQVVALHEAA